MLHETIIELKPLIFQFDLSVCMETWFFWGVGRGGSPVEPFGGKPTAEGMPSWTSWVLLQRCSKRRNSFRFLRGFFWINLLVDIFQVKNIQKRHVDKFLMFKDFLTYIEFRYGFMLFDSVYGCLMLMCARHFHKHLGDTFSLEHFFLVNCWTNEMPGKNSWEVIWSTIWENGPRGCHDGGCWSVFMSFLSSNCPVSPYDVVLYCPKKMHVSFGGALWQESFHWS